MRNQASPTAPGLTGDPALIKVMTEIDMIAHMAAREFERLLPAGVTRAQYGVVNRLIRLNAPETVSELAKAFQLAQPTMSSTVKRLCEKGLVELIPDTDDKRVKRVAATRAARAMRARAIESLKPYLDALEREAPQADWKATLAALTSVRAYLERRA